jgi:hypothetical protein
MENNERLAKMRQERFFINNRIVLQSVNMLREKYVVLRELMPALFPEVGENEFHDCINYLSEGGYIQSRDKISKTPTTLADTTIGQMESKLTFKGIQLLSGRIKDPCIDGYQ